MKCSKCGYEMFGGQKFCPVCGARVIDPSKVEQERVRREQMRQRERIEEEARAQAEREKQERAEQQEQNARRQAEQDDDETIVVDTNKARMFDTSDGYGFGDGGGFFDIFDMFGGGGGFGFSPFGRKSRGFGVFDIIDEIFGGGFGGGFGGRTRREHRAIVTKPDEFYHIDKFDDEGFPIFTTDKLIDVSPREFEKIKSESEGGKDKKRKRR